MVQLPSISYEPDYLQMPREAKTLQDGTYHIHRDPMGSSIRHVVADEHHSKGKGYVDRQVQTSDDDESITSFRRGNPIDIVGETHSRKRALVDMTGGATDQENFDENELHLKTPKIPSGNSIHFQSKDRGDSARKETSMENLSPYYIPDVSGTRSSRSSTYSLSGRDGHKAHKLLSRSDQSLRQVSPCSGTFKSDTSSIESHTSKGSHSTSDKLPATERTRPLRTTKRLEPTDDEEESQTVPISCRGCCLVHCTQETPKRTTVRSSQVPGKSATSQHYRNQPAPLSLADLSFGSTAQSSTHPDIQLLARSIGRDLALRTMSGGLRETHKTHLIAQESGHSSQPRSNASDPSSTFSQDFLARSPMFPVLALPLQPVQVQKVSHSPRYTRTPAPSPSFLSNNISPRDNPPRPSRGRSSPVRHIRNDDFHPRDSIAGGQGISPETFQPARRDPSRPPSIGGRSIRSRKSFRSRRSSVHSGISRFSDDSVHTLRGRVKSLLFRVAEKF